MPLPALLSKTISLRLLGRLTSSASRLASFSTYIPSRKSYLRTTRSETNRIPNFTQWNTTMTCLRSHLFRLYSTDNLDATPQTISDPNRPDIFYHLVSLQTSPLTSLPAYAVSFLPTPPPSPDSSTVLGWLPALVDGEAGLNDFQENPKFREVLHRAIQSGLYDEVDDIQINGAIQLREGWMHIHDNRNIPALGRIGDPDDILASVLVDDSKILPQSYQAMPSYRLCTADGPTHLTAGLAQKLGLLLEQTAAAEQHS